MEETPPRRRLAGEILYSDSELESVRIFLCREAEDESEGEEMGLSGSEESTCGKVGPVKDDGDSDSAKDSAKDSLMRLEWIKASESDESIREWRGRVDTEGVSDSSNW